MTTQPTTRPFSCQLKHEVYDALRDLAEKNCPPGYKPNMPAEVTRLILEAAKN